MEGAGRGSISTAMIVLIAVILVFGCVYYAGAVIAPVVFAMFMIALMWPFQSWLQKRMPKGLALAFSMLVVAAVFLVFGWIVAWGFGRVTRWIIADAGRFQTLYVMGVAWLEGHGIAVAGLWAEHFNVGWVVRAAQQPEFREPGDVRQVPCRRLDAGVVGHAPFCVVEIERRRERRRARSRQRGDELLAIEGAGGGGGHGATIAVDPPCDSADRRGTVRAPA